METFPRWSIAAVNLPEHADNPVHTVEGGLAAGYDGAVVAGTTVFAYLTHPVAAAWGRAWVVGGGYEVWFQGPVLADERVVVAGGSDKVVASVGERVCARLVPERAAETPSEASGTRLEPLVVELDDRWVGYAARAGEDLELWLIGIDAAGELTISTLGIIEGDADGTYEVPDDFDSSAFDTVLVDISYEPRDGDETHSGASIIRGEIIDT